MNPSTIDGGHTFDHNNLRPINEPGFIERIDKSTLKPMNDPNCTHEWVDDDDEIGDMRANVCRKCRLGRWVPKS